MTVPASPTVSVIVATYNRAESLRTTLASLLDQDLADFEAWVVGDGCTDGSEAVVAAFGDSRLRWVNLPRNSGSQAAPNNEGLRRATGRYVAYLGHDDLWFPWHLSALVERIETAGADFGHALCADLGPDGVASAYGPPRAEVPYAEHFVPPSCWLVRRDAAAAWGAWADPERLPWAVDFDYLRRAVLGGATMAFAPRLSVLKFPSPRFAGAYLNRGEPPHAPVLRRLLADPAAVERETLEALATHLARRDRGAGFGPFLRRPPPSPPAAPRRLVTAGLGRAVARYGFDRWPVAPFARRDYQRFRGDLRRRRGLPMGGGRPDGGEAPVVGPPIPVAGPVRQTGASLGLWPDAWVGEAVRFSVEVLAPVAAVALEGWRPPRHDGPAPLTIGIGGTEARRAVEAGPFRWEVPVPLGPATEVEVVVTSATTFCPAESDDSADQRQLSFVLRRVIFEPVP